MTDRITFEGSGAEKPLQGAETQVANRYGWLTNDPAIALRLHNADVDYANARLAASALPFAQKIEAYRKALRNREAVYTQVRVELGI